MRKAIVLIGVFLAGTAAAQLPTGDSGNTYTIPGIVAIGGQNGTRFVSDVAVTNPGTAASFAVVGLVPAGGLAPQFIPLDPGQTVAWRDVLQQLWSASSFSGALSIVSDQNLILRARTYNTASSGTFGVALPVYGPGDYLSSGLRAHALWVSQSPDPNAGYRTNAAVFFPDAGGSSATVRIFDGDGILIGQRDYALDAAGFQQLSVSTFSSPAAVARAEIEVTSGHAAGYSVVVDNVTGDSSLFPFEPLPAGMQDVLVSGVARTDGKLGTFFRTDGRFYNPGTVDASVTVAFHANQSSNPFPATAGFTVPAGKIVDVTDLLSSLLGLPNGSAGALRFQSDSAVGILCRTSNIDPTGAKPGTFGAQQKPVPLLSFLSSADAGALVTGIRQNATYRTNVGFAAGADGATYQLTLRSSAGTVVTSAVRSLGPFGWEQPAIDTIFSSIPADAQLLVKVTQGSADVFDSSVDNGSGDSVVTPAPSLPVDIPSSATIGPEGGSVRSDDGIMTLKIPAGAVGAPTVISISTAADVAPPETGGPAFRILPDGLAFSREALLVWSYGAGDVLGTTEEALSLAIAGGGEWYVLGGGCLDVSRRTLTVPLDALRAASSVRTPLASPTVLVATPLKTYMLIPGFKNVVEGAAAPVTFKVISVGHTSSAKAPKGSRPKVSSPSDIVARWYVDGQEAGQPGVDFSYQVPACAPPKKNVIIVALSPDITTFGLTSVVTVWPRHWTYEFDWLVDIAECSGSDGIEFTGKWGNHYSKLFDLDDALTVHLGEQLAPIPQTRPEPKMCPPRDCGYTQVAMGPFPMPSIDSFSGAVTGLSPLLELDVRMNNVGIPPFTFSGSSCKPPDRDRSTSLMGFGPRKENYTVAPGGLNASGAEILVVDGQDRIFKLVVSIRPDKCPR
jgi:hypothetical protein